MRAHTHTNPHSFYQKLEAIDFSAIFPSYSGTLDLEIGSGTGLFLRDYAKARPDRNIVGVEVRKKLADIVSERIQKDRLSNAHLVYGSAERLLEDAIPDNSIDNVYIFHPDPWFKTRHHNRRVIRPDFLTVLAPKLSGAAKIYISTDVTALWDAMIQTLSDAKWLQIEDPEFWKTYYTTHWQRYTQSDQRPQHFGVFKIGDKYWGGSEAFAW